MAGPEQNNAAGGLPSIDPPLQKRRRGAEEMGHPVVLLQFFGRNMPARRRIGSVVTGTFLFGRVLASACGACCGRLPDLKTLTYRSASVNTCLWFRSELSSLVGRGQRRRASTRKLVSLPVLLELKNIQKRYGGVSALVDANLSATPARCTCF